MAALLFTPSSIHVVEKKCQVFPSDRATPSSALVNGGAWLRPPTLRLAGAREGSSVEARRPRLVHPVAARRSEYDVVVVGGGIIGLTIARQFLLGSDHSVAVVDARVPCSGATGAGQGYIWMAYRTHGSHLWELALRSKQLWEDFARSVECQGMDPVQVLGWKKTGSLLIGRTLGELTVLQEKVKMLNKAGLGAVYLSASSLALEEPALDVGTDWGAAFYPDDCQLDAQRAVSFIQLSNKKFITEGRYAEFFNDPAICLLRSTRNGEVEAVQTSNNILHSRRAVIIAAGAWSGSLTQSLIGPEIALGVPVKPRKGHLLVLENFKNIQLNHGLMEVGYVNHQIASQSSNSSASSTTPDQSMSSISFTATTDQLGNLVLGSSRQFSGFNVGVDDAVVKDIWERAGEFFPMLREMTLDFFLDRQIRIGLRPYMPDGRPIIGPVPDLPKVFLATGHEGCGICTSLATAEMVADMVLENEGKKTGAWDLSMPITVWQQVPNGRPAFPKELEDLCWKDLRREPP